MLSTIAALTPQQGVVHTSRRAALAGLCTAVATPALAFDNGIADMALYQDVKKNPGSPPPDLGLRTRVLQRGDTLDKSLRSCDAAPNCFSTSALDDKAHGMPMWKPAVGADAMAQLLDVVKSYQPGQLGVDGGGFRIVMSKPDYIYVQYESLRGGFIDDVEFALGGDGVQVRSASRLGFLDFAVNAKRLNALSAKLRALGWDAPALTPASHPIYFGKNTRS